MSAEVSPLLTLERVRSTPSHVLLTELKAWLIRTNPNALLHPHGFLIVLLSRTNDEEWRFHFWPQGSRIVTGMPAFIHTHDRHVDSWILQGRLTNIMYEVQIVPVAGRPLYEVGYTGDRYRSETSNVLRRTTLRVQANVLSEATMQRGDSYRVDRHAYHEAVVPEDLCTATLVCMHGRAPGAVRVVGVAGFPKTIVFRRTELKASAFVDKLAPQR
jgi:hypothetical protein